MLKTLRRHPTTAGHPGPTRGAEPGDRSFSLALAAAVCLGVLVRALYTFSTDFPLNDGGMFYVMVRDLQRAHFLLPAFTTYNGLDLPYAYSPFGFYAAGVLDSLTPLSLMQVFRFLPLAVSCLTVAAFALLARTLLGPGRTTLAAVCAFAVIPASFTWLLMGGGVTRAFGFLFAILALQQAYLLYTRRRWRHVVPAALFCGLTVLSHLGTAPFLAFSIVVFFLARGRHREGVLGSLAVALGALLVTAPWWAAVIARHGLDPFLAARASGGLGGIGGLKALVILILRLTLSSTHEPLFPLLLALALAGALACLSSGRYLIPAWWAAIILLEYRAYALYTTLPVAMLAGVGVTEVLLPLASRARDTARQGTPPPRPARWLPALLVCFLLGYSTLAALTGLKKSPSALVAEARALRSLTPDERVAMRWVAEETDPGSRFLVVTGHEWEPLNVYAAGTHSGWYDDRASEWFPVLAERRSVATPQGWEWMPDDAFGRHVLAYRMAQRCANRSTECIEEWARMYEAPFTHVYIPRSPLADPDVRCCGALRESLGRDARYRLVYDGPGALIFARR